MAAPLACRQRIEVVLLEAHRAEAQTAVRSRDLLIETAKRNGVEPQTWLTDILTRIGEGWPASRRDAPMPWNWQAAAECDRLTA